MPDYFINPALETLIRLESQGIDSLCDASDAGQMPPEMATAEIQKRTENIRRAVAQLGKPQGEKDGIADRVRRSPLTIDRSVSAAMQGGDADGD